MGTVRGSGGAAGAGRSWAGGRRGRQGRQLPSGAARGWWPTGLLLLAPASLPTLAVCHVPRLLPRRLWLPGPTMRRSAPSAWACPRRWRTPSRPSRECAPAAAAGHALTCTPTCLVLPLPCQALVNTRTPCASPSPALQPRVCGAGRRVEEPHPQRPLLLLVCRPHRVGPVGGTVRHPGAQGHLLQRQGPGSSAVSARAAAGASRQPTLSPSPNHTNEKNTPLPLFCRTSCTNRGCRACPST